MQPVSLLPEFGPEACRVVSVDEARAMSRRLAVEHAENFTVMSRFIPADRRDDFAAFYAFCRWADDLADEIGDAERSRELLAWWREELARCLAGEPRHPVFVALEPTIKRHELPAAPFEALIAAFESDQEQSSWETWDDLLDYCRGSANPVGRVVLMMLGEPRTDEIFAASDATCTALQLTNHWQDVRRDMIDRGRVYLPGDINPIEDFAGRLRKTIEQGYAPDHDFLRESREVIREAVSRTWKLYKDGTAIFPLIGAESRPLIWLLSAGGQSVLRMIEMWNYESVMQRPVLGRLAKFNLVLSTTVRARCGAFKRVTR